MERMALIGGGEFDSGFEGVHAELLARTGIERPVVVYFPTAAAKDGPGVAEYWAGKAVSHLRDLGANAEAAMILDREGAEDAEMIALICRADVIYLGGGLPQVYLEILRDSAAWKAVVERYQQGAWLVGASAGAMILGEACLVATDQGDYPPSQWTQGLNVLAGIGIAPHTNTFPYWWIETITTEKPDTITLIGIDEQTALVAQGQGWQVLGKGSVTLWGKEDSQQFNTGAVIPSLP